MPEQLMKTMDGRQMNNGGNGVGKGGINDIMIFGNIKKPNDNILTTTEDSKSCSNN